MKHILPYRGEFGHLCMTYAPVANAISGEKTVYCEPGMEAMYPGASRFVHVDTKPDIKRRELTRYDQEWLLGVKQAVMKSLPAVREEDIIYPNRNMQKQRFVPDPFEVQGVSDVDVVICPRKRAYGHMKNWACWPELAHRLSVSLNVFAAGVEESSYWVDCPKAWDRARPLDATIEAMQRAKVVLTTDNGLAHLAVMCGRPVLLITDKKECTAPGYRRVRMDRYCACNHLQTPVVLIKGGWENVDKVVEQCREWVKDHRRMSAVSMADRYRRWKEEHVRTP